jgi:hypothetical protein
VTGAVVDAESGLPVVGATVAAHLLGQSTVLATATVSAFGAFRLTLSAGSYGLDVHAPGYVTQTVAVAVGTSSGPVTVLLVPVSNSGPSPTSFPVTDLAIAAAGIGGALLVGALVLRAVQRRRPPPPESPARWTLDDEEATVGPD